MNKHGVEHLRTIHDARRYVTGSACESLGDPARTMLLRYLKTLELTAEQAFAEEASYVERDEALVLPRCGVDAMNSWVVKPGARLVQVRAGVPAKVLATGAGR